MTGKQWLLVTMIVILNIIVFGALLGGPPVDKRGTSNLTPPVYPTFTATPFPTATAIVMPTMPPELAPAQAAVPTPSVHVVAEGETVDSIAETYGISSFVVRMINRLADTEEVHAGQKLIIPPAE
jgi:LysM repeat protein